MVNMVKWVLEVGLAVLLSGLEAAALVAFWFVEGMKKWAAEGGPVPGETGRYFLVLSVGSTSSALISYGFSWADLPVACASQAVLAALLTLLLILGAGTECGNMHRLRSAGAGGDPSSLNRTMRRTSWDETGVRRFRLSGHPTRPIPCIRLVSPTTTPTRRGIRGNIPFKAKATPKSLFLKPRLGLGPVLLAPRGAVAPAAPASAPTTAAVAAPVAGAAGSSSASSR